MKKVVAFLSLLLLFGCSKPVESETIVGKWRIIEITDDVHGEKVNDPNCYIQFYRDGRLIINSSVGVLNNSYYRVKNLDHYNLLPNNYIKYYNKQSGDSLIGWYGFHNGLYLSYGYLCDIYYRTP